MSVEPEELIALLNEIKTSIMSPTGWFSCPICGMYRIGDPPHGNGQPCPEKLKMDAAHLDHMEMQKASYAGAGMMNSDLKEMLSKMTKSLIRDDDDE